MTTTLCPNNRVRYTVADALHAHAVASVPNGVVVGALLKALPPLADIAAIVTAIQALFM